MKNLLLIILLSFGLTVGAQVAINTDGSTPDNSAMLDVKSTTQGFLSPRMTTAQKLAIASPATGLLVFDTDLNQFQVYTGATGWISLLVSSSGWLTTGNSGTVDATNFIGTTDNKPLNFRVFNQKAGRIDNGLMNTFLGYQSGNSNTIGTVNTFFGYQSGFANNSGGNNSAFGNLALKSDITGNHNTAIGNEALNSATSGLGATAIGSRAMYYANSNAGLGTVANVAVGFEACAVRLLLHPTQATTIRQSAFNPCSIIQLVQTM
ncbi:MAG: hypothetical protein IPH84_19065 [Bacteroidales bacterium]|nr:hypothetical protein [Bacteroidales bacterium]